MFEWVPSGGEPSVRTHVPLEPTRSPRRTRGRPACTRRGALRALVPATRARPRGRLGGRVGSERGVPAAAWRASGARVRRPAAAPPPIGRTRSSPPSGAPTGSARAGAAPLPRGRRPREPSFGPDRAPARGPAVRHPSLSRAVVRQPIGPRASRPAPMSAGLPPPPMPAGYQPAARGPPPRGPPLAPRRALSKKTGGVLLSQALASQVPSALRGLTSLFGMGRGVSPSLKPPKKARPASPVPQNCTAPHGIRGSKNPSSPRPISTGLLQTLPSFQIRPINLVVYQGSYSL